MGRYSLLAFFKDQFTSLPDIESIAKDLTGKTVIITGANSGLGLEAARHFATMNPARLILGCRSLKSAEEAVGDIQQTTGCQNVEYWPLDLSSFRSVSDFSDCFEREGGGKLDILVQNAGIVRREYVQTNDGYESILQTNHLSSAFLTLLLLPSLSKVESRIVFVTSELHLVVEFLKEAESPNMIEKLNDKDHCNPEVMRYRYCVTKALNIFFVRALAARLPSYSNITVNAVTPGLCHSKITRDLKGIGAAIYEVFVYLFARSTEAGSRTIVHAALSGSQENMQAKYLNTCRVAEESDFILSVEGPKVQDRLWNETIDILAKQDKRVRNIMTQILREA
ncbi:NAD(P)-binding protein [Sistotremastrum suecicum HHB10207 ss-3]|uniref:NAD(P)-binding protein n=1 Tax=Sistotremastrum suecicum HHB10207 ss-3 TaxID=1314776 RepID=A0A166E4K0_9AGAM|nr:NAD(P)-binding protein [Sistotremastrum suecicum HHB10207 ss-3]